MKWKTWQAHTQVNMHFSAALAHSNTLLLKADLRQCFCFNNANKHLYCFIWWMAWFMRKSSNQQYFCSFIPGDSEKADFGGEKGEPLPETPPDMLPLVVIVGINNKVSNVFRIYLLNLFENILFTVYKWDNLCEKINGMIVEWSGDYVDHSVF